MLQAETIQELAGRLRGEALIATDDGYDAARASWNGRIDRRPIVVIRAAAEEDIPVAVNFAREQGLPFTVKSTGHHVLGHSVADNGVVLDLSALKQIDIDPEASRATIEPGVTAGEFMAAIENAGFITTIGSHSSVGMTGLTLGGGIGILMAKYGLASDNLASADLYTADGARHTASESQNPDLFWAIRGGGGNFGVAARLTLRLHRPEGVVAGIVGHPFPRAVDVLRFYRDFTRTCPDELSVFAVLRTGPHGHPICGMMACYVGPVDKGQELLKPLKEFGPPVVDMIQPMPYSGLLHALEGTDPPGAHYAFSACGLSELTDDVIDTIVKFGGSRTSDGSTVVLYHQHGEAARKPADSTAYAGRQIPYFVGMFAGWNGGDADPHTAWISQFVDALSTSTVHGCTVNFLGDEGEEAVRATYGDNYGRLAQVKQTWDPGNFFAHNHNIAPAA